LGLTKQKEIDSIKREVLSLQGSREDIEEDLMSEIDVLDDSEKALKTEQPLMLEQTNINNKKKVTIAAFAEETKLDLDPILQEINVEISSLPDSFKKRYNRIASRLDRPIVKVEGNFCGACYSFISSQQLAELKKMQIGDCKNCSRILFAAANVPEKVDD
jgi:predicted  nucleic acid-binding Zn-ribbon protein